MGSGRSCRELRHDSREPLRDRRSSVRDSVRVGRDISREGRHSKRETQDFCRERRSSHNHPRESTRERKGGRGRGRERQHKHKHRRSSEKSLDRRKESRRDKHCVSEKSGGCKSGEDVGNKRQSRFDIVGPVPKSKRLIAPPLILDNLAENDNSTVKSLRDKALYKLSKEGQEEKLFFTKMVDQLKHKQQELKLLSSTQETGIYKESIKILEQHTQQLQQKSSDDQQAEMQKLVAKGFAGDNHSTNNVLQTQGYGKSVVQRSRLYNKPALKFVSGGRFLPSIGSMEEGGGKGGQTDKATSSVNLIKQWTQQMEELGLQTCQVDVASQEQHNSSTYGKGYSLLKKLGYQEGQGLGKDLQGISQPVSLDYQRDKKGISYVKATATDQDEENTDASKRDHHKRRKLRRKLETKLNLPAGALSRFKEADLEQSEDHIVQLVKNIGNPGVQSNKVYQNNNNININMHPPHNMKMHPPPHFAHTNGVQTFHNNRLNNNTPHVGPINGFQKSAVNQIVQKEQQFYFQHNQQQQQQFLGYGQGQSVFSGGGGGGKRASGLKLPPPIAINGVPVGDMD